MVQPESRYCHLNCWVFTPLFPSPFQSTWTLFAPSVLPQSPHPPLGSTRSTALLLAGVGPTTRGAIVNENLLPLVVWPLPRGGWRGEALPLPRSLPPPSLVCGGTGPPPSLLPSRTRSSPSVKRGSTGGWSAGTMYQTPPRGGGRDSGGSPPREMGVEGSRSLFPWWMGRGRR